MTNRFLWTLVTTQPDERHWALCRELARLQRDLIPGVIAGDDREIGQRFALAVDLEIGADCRGILDDLGVDSAAHPGCRYLVAIADEQSPAVLRAGSTLELVAKPWDLFYDYDANVWQAADGASFVSALDGKWGFAAFLADSLIVPAESELAGNPQLGAELLAALRRVTIEFRRDHACRPATTLRLARRQVTFTDAD